MSAALTGNSFMRGDVDINQDDVRRSRKGKHSQTPGEYLMISEVSKSQPFGRNTRPGGAMDHRVHAVISFMRDNIRRELFLSEVAQLVNLSPSRLRYLFKTETGISPTQYLKLIRMQRATNLLETTFLSVKEIMNNIGVNDKSHFMREFKKIHGVTPARYRTRLATSDDAPKSIAG